MEITKEQFYEYIRKKDEPETLGKAIRAVEQEGEMAICDGTRYYLHYYDQLVSKKKIIKWNWSAFLCQSLWLGYRKAYVPVIVVSIIPFIIQLIIGIFFWAI